MVNRVEGYSYKEIHTALERQKFFRGSERFVIPATLDPCDGLEELDHLNRADLTEDVGVNRIAQEILADWESRQKKQGERVQ